MPGKAVDPSVLWHEANATLRNSDWGWVKGKAKGNWSGFLKDPIASTVDQKYQLGVKGQGESATGTPRELIGASESHPVETQVLGKRQPVPRFWPKRQGGWKDVYPGLLLLSSLFLNPTRRRAQRDLADNNLLTLEVSLPEHRHDSMDNKWCSKGTYHVHTYWESLMQMTGRWEILWARVRKLSDLSWGLFGYGLIMREWKATSDFHCSNWRSVLLQGRPSCRDAAAVLETTWKP